MPKVSRHDNLDWMTIGPAMVNHEKISRRVAELKHGMELAQKEINRIQDVLCDHSNKEGTHGSNTGNYDPSADCYWVQYACPDCKKRWTVDI
jgi:hypothetical protein